jgi:uncharacterized protein (TIRG00374 family)
MAQRAALTRQGAGTVTARTKQIMAGVLLGVVVAALCLVFALNNVEMWRLRVEIKNAEFIWTVPLLASVFLFYRLKSLRWALLLSPITRVSGGRLFPSVIIGYATNTLVPLQFGDVLRAGIAARAQKLPTAPVLMSIGFERVIDLVTLLVPVSIALAALPQVPDRMRNVVMLFSALTLAALALVLFYLFWTRQFMAITTRVCSVLPARLAAAVIKHTELGVTGVAALRSPVLLLKVLLTSILHWGVWIFAVWCSLCALEIDVPPVAALFATVLLVIGTNLPNSPGYVGSIQLAYVLALKPFGASAEEALAASVLFHLFAYPSIVLVGIAYLRRQRIGWHELREILPGPAPGGSG